jgi:hypothetical protein
MGIDPMLIDPENGNFQLAENSPAVGYGCQTFNTEKKHVEKKQIKDSFKYSINRNLIEVSGEITSDTFWDADTVLVTGNVSLENNATLFISAGTQIKFNDFYGVHIIDGNVLAIGNATQRIVFSSSQPELFRFDESYSGAWQGFFFDNVSDNCDESRFEYCVFEYAKAVSESRVQGGAFHFDGTSKATIENSAFRYNIAYYGGAISTSYCSNPMVMSSVFYHNYDLLKGSAFYITNSYPKLINNTIVDNHSLNSDSNDETATIFTYFSKPKFYNNIIRNNTTNFFELLQIRENKIYYTRNNNIEQWLDGYDNINAEAAFAYPPDFDFSLLPSSPCIDAAFLPTNYLMPQYDIVGNERISGTSIDMGAYEFQASSFSPEEISFLSVSAMQIYPNPFNPQTKISFTLNESSHIRLTVYNMKGQKISTILDTNLSHGDHAVSWNGENDKGQEVASGIYLFQLKMNDIPVSYSKGILLK